MPKENKGEMPDTKPEGEMSKGSDDGKETSTAKLQAELAETRKALKAANSEAADRRKKLQAYEDAETERKEAEMSEIEKLQTQLSERDAMLEQMKTSLLTTKFSAEVQRHATKLKFRNPEDAEAFMHIGDFEVDDKDNFKGVESALNDIIKERPYLIDQAKMPDTDGTKRNTAKASAQSEVYDETIKKRYGIRG